MTMRSQRLGRSLRLDDLQLSSLAVLARRCVEPTPRSTEGLRGVPALPSVAVPPLTYDDASASIVHRDEQMQIDPALTLPRIGSALMMGLVPVRSRR